MHTTMARITRPTVRTVEAVEEEELSVYLLREYVTDAHTRRR